MNPLKTITFILFSIMVIALSALSAMAGPLDPVQFKMSPNVTTVWVGGQNGTVTATGIISGLAVLSGNQTLLTLSNHSQYLTVSNISLFEPAGNGSGGTLTTANLTLFLLATNHSQYLLVSNSSLFQEAGTALSSANLSLFLLSTNHSQYLLVSNESTLDVNSSAFWDNLDSPLNFSSVGNVNTEYLGRILHADQGNLSSLNVSTIQGFFDSTCPNGMFVTDIGTNGSLVCGTPSAVATLTGEGVTINSTGHANLNLTYTDLFYYNQTTSDARFLQTSNLSLFLLVQNISNFLDLRYLQSTNQTFSDLVVGTLNVSTVKTYFDGACAANEFVINITESGTLVCAQPVVAASNVTSGEGVEVNSSNNVNLNNSYVGLYYMNRSVYEPLFGVNNTAGNGISLLGQVISVSEAYLNSYFANLSVHGALWGVNNTAGNGISLSGQVISLSEAYLNAQFLNRSVYEGYFGINNTAGNGISLNEQAISVNEAYLNLHFLNASNASQFTSDDEFATALTVSNVSNFLDIRYLQATNQTLADLTDVGTLGITNYRGLLFSGNSVNTSNLLGFFDGECPAGQFVTNVTQEGTLVCATPVAGSANISGGIGIEVNSTNAIALNITYVNLHFMNKSIYEGFFGVNNTAGNGISLNGQAISLSEAYLNSYFANLSVHGALWGINNTAGNGISLNGQEISVLESYLNSQFLNRSVYEPYLGVNNTAGNGILLSGQAISVNEAYLNLHFLNASNASAFAVQNTPVQFTNTNVSSLLSTGIVSASEFNGALNWTNLQNYPAGCAAGSGVQNLSDTPNCYTPQLVFDLAPRLGGNLNATEKSISDVSEYRFTNSSTARMYHNSTALVIEG